jgi:hypothetical protein
MEDYTKALRMRGEIIKEMRALARSLTGLAKLGMTVSKGGAVVVPLGSTVVSCEDVNVGLDSRKVRSVDNEEICAGNQESKAEARSLLRHRCAVVSNYCAGVIASLTQLRAIASQSLCAEAST